VDLTASLDAPVPVDDLYAWVDDLVAYPAWLPLVAAAQPFATGDARRWDVELRARFGPLARSKRLRMARTVQEAGRLAVFERAEDDGRTHAAWVLRAETSAITLADGSAGSHLTMRLHYGGSLWGPMLERVLTDQIEQGRRRLLELVTAGERPPSLPPG
jgi:hypothetical protein